MGHKHNVWLPLKNMPVKQKAVVVVSGFHQYVKLIVLKRWLRSDLSVLCRCRVREGRQRAATAQWALLASTKAERRTDYGPQV